MINKVIGLPPRNTRLAWKDRHMLEALISAERSPDPNTQVGACIVNQTNRVISTGYNSFPNGIAPHIFPWDRENKDPLLTKYPYIVHAERNAIHNAQTLLHGCTLFVTMYPCNDCAKDIIQSGIKHIEYLTNPYENTWQVKAAQKLFQTLDITVYKHIWNNKDQVLACLQKLSTLVSSSL